jgi:hypothetical protein
MFNPLLLTYDYRIQVFFSGRNHHSTRKRAPGKSYPPPQKIDFYDLQIRSMDEQTTRAAPRRLKDVTASENGCHNDRKKK